MQTQMTKNVLKQRSGVIQQQVFWWLVFFFFLEGGNLLSKIEVIVVIKIFHRVKIKANLRHAEVTLPL